MTPPTSPSPDALLPNDDVEMLRAMVVAAIERKNETFKIAPTKLLRIIDALAARTHASAPTGQAGCDFIAQERQRQIEQEGWTPEHDDEYTQDELAISAAIYAAPGYERSNRPRLRGALMQFWPWDHAWFKPNRNDRVRELVKAGALIAAEIDRLKRAAPKPESP